MFTQTHMCKPTLVKKPSKQQERERGRERERERERVRERGREREHSTNFTVRLPSNTCCLSEMHLAWSYHFDRKEDTL